MNRRACTKEALIFLHLDPNSYYQYYIFRIFCPFSAHTTRKRRFLYGEYIFQRFFHQ